MGFILNIDSSTETAFVTIANNGSIIGFAENKIQKDHAEFLHPAIKNIMQDAGMIFQQLDAIAVTAGPGSYTGIRVGMATAKGLSFSLNKPLITINSLELLARDAITQYPGKDNSLFCPMIDARRMEIYTAIYDSMGNEILSPRAIVIEKNFYREYSTKWELIFFGSGAQKCKALSAFQEATLIENVDTKQSMSFLTHELFLRNSFTDLISSQPFYLKEFFNK